MTKLTTERRSELPENDFALKNGRYPINDPNHARAALSMAHYATPAEQAQIKRKVHARFPGIGQK
jgi:hypothetical protein